MVFRLPSYKISGLKFESKSDYQLFRDFDKNINETVKQVKNKQLQLKDVFKDVKTIIIEELYYCASDEIDGTFPNATHLLEFEDSYDTDAYMIACKFFDKIRIVEFKVDDEI